VGYGKRVDGKEKNAVRGKDQIFAAWTPKEREKEKRTKAVWLKTPTSLRKTG